MKGLRAAESADAKHTERPCSRLLRVRRLEWGPPGPRTSIKELRRVIKKNWISTEGSSANVPHHFNGWEEHTWEVTCTFLMFRPQGE